MEKGFWIAALQTKLNDSEILVKKYISLGMELYLFGSALKKRFPADLDIAILYNQCDMKEARTVRDITTSTFHSVFSGPIDIILLSFTENQETQFLIKEKAELIFPTF